LSTTVIPFETYRRKALGCWLGKAVGGTLGGPVEGQGGPLRLTFYDPAPDCMLPNDDLDLQVVWLEALRRRGLPVERRTLAQAWLEHIHLWPDEYGVACRNLTMGLYPPASGAFDNGFTAGMGSAIRSELWACLAPGDPQLAATLAREDACVDHAGEGIHSEVYLATLESAAFVESDRETLLDLAAAAIPGDCRVARAIADTRQWWAESGDWLKVREQLLQVHGRQNFTDVAQNLAITVLGWLAGEGDFGKAICAAVNCGKDTDCTGATLGALLGILDPDSIGEEWLKPIGRDLVLSAGIVGMHPAATLDEFTDQVAALALDVLEYYDSEVSLSNAPSLKDARENLSPPRHERAAGIALATPTPTNESLLVTEPLAVTLVYPPSVALTPGQPANLTVRLVNPTERALDLCLDVRAPDGWQLETEGTELVLAAGATETVALTVVPPGPERSRPYSNPLDLWLDVEGLLCPLSAGLVLTLPWRRWRLRSLADDCPQPPRGAELVEAAGHFQPLPDGSQAFASEVKLPFPCTLRYIAQAPRQVRVWLDGELINQHDGTHQVPAVHRAGPTGRDLLAARGWHRLTVAVGDGKGGELFVGLGDGESWDWLRQAEWRDPLTAALNR